jgi:hypothetical protein
MKVFFSLLPFLLLPLGLLAQRSYPTKLQSRELISLSAGATSFFGDVQGNNGLIGRQPHVGISYEYLLLRRLGLRTSVHWYRIAASDADSDRAYLRDRNLSFTSSNLELSLQAVIYALPNHPLYYASRSRFNAFGLLGLGATYFNPRADYQGSLLNLRELQTEGVGYGAVALVIPFGGGISYRLSPQLDVSLQATYHFTTTDYLDDVSTRYRDPASFSDPIAAALADRRPELGLNQERAGAIRGNPTVKDSYSMLSLRLQYHLARYHYRGRAFKKRFQD